MRGFLPPWIAIPLTERWNNLIDFSFFGRTSYNKGVLHYSKQQVVDRAYIWAAIIGGVVTANILDKTLREEPSMLYMTLEMLLAAGLSGYLAHEQIMRPRINHRKSLMNETDETQQRILAAIPEEWSDIKSRLTDNLIPSIYALSAKTADQANATMTLVLRKQAMERLEFLVKNRDYQENDASISDFFRLERNEQLDLLKEIDLSMPCSEILNKISANSALAPPM